MKLEDEYQRLLNSYVDILNSISAGDGYVDKKVLQQYRDRLNTFSRIHLIVTNQLKEK